MTLATFIQASAHDMPQVATGSVQAIVTSPPYYGLRAYQGDQGVEWPAVEYAPMPGLPPLTVPAMRSPLGNEPTLEAFIAHLILCLREWRRILRDDGVLFCNLGDSYANTGVKDSSKVGGFTGARIRAGVKGTMDSRPRAIPNGLKPKDLMLVPARFALAAQADGWFLRSDIIGVKIAPMPESVQDRPTRSHEHIFMLTKRARYFWDAEAVKEQGQERQYTTWEERKEQGEPMRRGDPGLSGHVNRVATLASGPGRNMRDVIEWRPAPFSGSHFAVFPEAIPERFIRAATSERGACPTCGAPWARVVERGFTAHNGNTASRYENGTTANRLALMRQAARENGGEYVNTKQTTGFAPTCTCPAHDPVPCVVLDPFSGSGTTARAAVRLGRRGIGVDIAAEYLTDVTAQRFGAGVQMELTGAR